MEISYQDINCKTIDRWVDDGWEWGKPISREVYAAAKNGQWDVKLTPVKFVPHDWFGDLKGRRVLGLAAGGGQQMPIFAALCLLGILLSSLLVKPLNAILLGERYASNLGVNIQRTRSLLLLATGLLTAVITAYCGPIAFIGLATPHIAFLVIGTSNHRLLLPATLIAGSIIALLCNLLCTLPASTVVPLNAVTPIMGVPVILYIVLKRNR